MEKVIDFAHNVIKSKVSQNDYCVDMTVGNGNDTLFLCGLAKHVYGFDIQQLAIDNTQKKLKENNFDNYSLYLDSHENLSKYVTNKVKAFIYNLGYLPKGDKTITTNYISTINSLKQALLLLDNNGVIVLVIYEGHDEGKIESIKIN